MLAIITGSARGIGLAIKQTLIAASHQVIGIDKEASGADTIACDLSDPAQITATFEQIIQQFGTPQILVNNAGIYLVKPWDQLTADDFDQTIAINTRAQFLLSQLFAKALIVQQLPGNIVNMSSVVGQNGSSDIAYGASKGAVLAMTKSLAKALAPHNIRVNAVAPGPIDTVMAARIPADRMEGYKAGIAMKRLGTAAEVAQAVAFLTSEQASYITGAVLNVDGGLYW